MLMWPVLAAGALLCACGGSPPAPSVASGLTKVEIGSYQALPPPYGTRNAVLTAPSDLTKFAAQIAADGIAVTTPTSSEGCAGGIQYTVLLFHRDGGKTTLSAYECGGSITGNLSGNVRSFVSYLYSLL